MATKFSWIEYRLWDGPRPNSKFRFAPGEISQLRTQVKIVKCTSCELSMVAGQAYHQEIYRAFGDEPCQRWPYCRACLDDGRDRDDASSFWCDGCSREVVDDDVEWLHGEVFCARCVFDDKVRYGHDVDEILAQKVKALDALHATEERLQGTGWELSAEVFWSAKPWAVLAHEVLNGKTVLLVESGGRHGVDYTVWSKPSERELYEHERDELLAMMAFEMMTAA